MKFIKRLIIALFIILLAGGSFFYFRHQAYYAKGDYLGEKVFEIKEGEGNKEIAARLKNEGMIAREVFFYYYIKTNDLEGGIFPGKYSLSGAMTIPEIVQIITNPEEKFIKVTFPEGFTVRQMAARLNANNLPGDEFLLLAEKPGDLKKRYNYLQPEAVKTLEGYLFPDTYFFKPDITAENIVGRMLDTFDGKLDGELKKEITAQKKTVNEVVIMASILEKEVQSLEDMKMASGIFWGRLAVGQRLESDAPLSYILDDNNDSHSGKDLELDSPYNTYRYAGLPPSPIGNPGSKAILAAIEPTASSYNFFLTATVDGVKKVIYSKTYEEHLANKNKYGL